MSTLHYKFTNQTSTHYNYTFKEGINIDPHPWNTDESSVGGFYSVPKAYFYEWLLFRHDLYYVYDVEHCDHVQINHESQHKTKCHAIKLTNKRRISDMIEWQDSNICSKAIKYHTSLLKYIPLSMKTHELCLEAVKYNVSALKYINQSIKTDQFCLDVVRLDGYALYYLPRSRLTYELCLEAVKQNGCVLFHVPEHFKNAEIYFEAVKQNSKMLKLIPQTMRTPDMYLVHDKNIILAKL